MIKKRILAVMVVLMLLLLTGCIKSTQSVSVNSDGSGTVKMVMGIAKEYQSMLEQQGTSVQDAFKDQTSTFEDKGFTVSDYQDDKYTGIALTKEYANIEDAKDVLSGITIDVSDTDPKTVTISGNIDAASEMEAQGQDMSALQQYGDFEMTFELVLPNAPTSSNATTVNGNTLTWNLLTTSSIQAEAPLTGGAGMPTWLIFVIIGGVVIIAAVVLLIVLSGRKKRAAVGPEQYVQQYQPPQQPVQPVAPAAPVTGPVPEAAPAPEPEAVPEQETAPEADNVPEQETKKTETEIAVERHIQDTIDKYK